MYNQVSKLYFYDYIGKKDVIIEVQKERNCYISYFKMRGLDKVIGYIQNQNQMIKEDNHYFLILPMSR
jgi:hypothetical protein